MVKPKVTKKEGGQPISPLPQVEKLIRSIRGERMILDSDLAAIYGVPTKVFNQAVKRNQLRFPDDFMFRLTMDEALSIQSLRSQSVTLKRGQNIKYLPYVFTEHGAIMAATILNSTEAVAMSVFVVRAFIQMREQIATNAAILKRLAEIDKTLLDQDHALRTIWSQLQPLLNSPPAPPKPRIGFKP